MTLRSYTTSRFDLLAIASKKDAQRVRVLPIDLGNPKEITPL